MLQPRKSAYMASFRCGESDNHLSSSRPCRRGDPINSGSSLCKQSLHNPWVNFVSECDSMYDSNCSQEPRSSRILLHQAQIEIRPLRTLCLFSAIRTWAVKASRSLTSRIALHTKGSPLIST